MLAHTNLLSLILSAFYIFLALIAFFSLVFTLVSPLLLTASPHAKSVQLSDNCGSRILFGTRKGILLLGHERVYRSNINGILIGKVLDRLTDKNIALLRLSALQLYRDEIFRAKLAGGTIVKPNKKSGIPKSFLIRKNDKGTMNNPFSGQ